MLAGVVEIQMMADLARIKRDMDEARGIVEGATDRMGRAFDTLRNVIATLGAAALLGELADITDRFKSLEGRMQLAAGSAAAATAQIDLLTAAANRQQAPLEEVIKLYLGAQRSANDLGATTAQLTKFTEGVSAGLKLSGSSAQSASGSLGQLTQLLGGTNVQAQEFNSLIDGMPDVLRTVAANLDGTGVSMGELRKRVVDGKLPVKEFFTAFLSGADDMIKKAEGLPPTVGGAFTLLSNNVLLAVGRIDKELGVSGAFAAGVKALGESIPDLIGPVLKLTAAIEPAIKIAAAYFAVFVGLPAIMTAAVTAFNAFALAVYNGATMGTVLTALNAGTMTLTTSVGTLALAASGLFALFAGWQIGSYLRENFQVAALAGIAFVEGVMVGWERMKLVALSAWAVIQAGWETALSGMGGFMASFLQKIAGGLSALGLDTAAQKVIAWAATVTDATRSSGDLAGRLGTLRQQYDTAAASIRTITGDMAMDTIAKFNNAAQTSATTAEIEKITTATGNSTVANTKAAAEAKRVDDAYVSLRNKITDKIGVLLQEEQQTTKLTDGQKLALSVMQDIQSGTLKLTDARKVEITALLEQMLQTEASRDATELETAAKRDAEKATASAVKEAQKFLEATQKKSESLEQEIVKQTLANEELRTGVKALGDNTAEKYEAAAMAADRAALVALERNEDLALYETLKTQAAQYRELAALKRDGVLLAEAREVRQEWDKTTEAIGKGLTDSLFRAFESGGKFWDTLWDGVKNTVKTTILKPIIEDTAKPFLGLWKEAATWINTSVLKPLVDNVWRPFMDSFMDVARSIANTVIRPVISAIVNPITGGISAFLGSGTASASGGGVSGAASGIGTIGNLASIGGTIAGGLGAFGSGASAGLALGAEGIGAAMSMIGSATGVSSMAAGLGQLVGAAGPYALAAAAALAIGKKLFGGGGGPKTESGFDTTGAGGVGALNNPGQAQQILADTQALYAQYAKALGGEAGALGGTSFVSIDTKGKANTQFVLDATLNGANVFSRNNRLSGGNVEDVGRDPSALAAAVAEAQVRATVAALQATTFADPQIASMIKGLNSGMGADSLSAELQKIVAYKADLDRAATAASAASAGSIITGNGAGLSAVDAQNAAAIGSLSADYSKFIDLQSRTAAAAESTAKRVEDSRGWFYDSATAGANLTRQALYDVATGQQMRDSSMLGELQSLRAEVAQLTAQLAAGTAATADIAARTAIATERTEQLLRNVSQNGTSLSVKTTT